MALTPLVVVLLSSCTGPSIEVEDLRSATDAETAGRDPVGPVAVDAPAPEADTVTEDGTVPLPAIVEPAGTPARAVIEPAEAFSSMTSIGSAAAIVSKLTVEQKVGQLIVAALWGTDATAATGDEQLSNQAIGRADTPAEVVIRQELGGVLFLRRNVVDGSQVATLSAGLQEAAAPSGIGLLIAVDQEGGRVNRVSNGTTSFQSARELAGNADAVRGAAAITAAEMLSMGVNVVLAPVADVTDRHDGIIGDRSYGGDPQLVARMVMAAIDGLQTGDGFAPGAAAAVKHWPGHGDTQVDSHRGLPVIGVDEATWRSRDLIPFAAAVDAGVDVVLVGHLSLPGIDPSGDPATISPVLIDGHLRRGLGFDGVVMTDALDMGAVAGLDQGELAVRSVLAGADILLAPPDVQLVGNALLEALSSGRLSMTRLDISVARVIRLKQKLGLAAP